MPSPQNPEIFHVLRIISLGGVSCVCLRSGLPPWEATDWTQWTKEDCERILHHSPWASSYSDSVSKGTVLITSSLVVRQAIVKLGQKDALCLNKNFGDQIEVTVLTDSYNDFKSPPELIISGRKYAAFQSSKGDPPLDPCVAMLPYVSTDVYLYPRSVDGKPITGLGDKSLVIKGSYNREFNFSIKKMVYKGKPDF
jgi:hypothetical protein